MYELKSEVLAAYNDRAFSNSLGADLSAAFQATYVQLTAGGGFETLHDVVTLLEPLMAITIDEEAELYITSSAVVPRLVDVHREIAAIFAACKPSVVSQPPDLPAGVTIMNKESVNNWAGVFDCLWATYVQAFTEDELFLTASKDDWTCAVLTVSLLSLFSLSCCGFALESTRR